MADIITEHEGWSVWCCGWTDWIAAKSFEEAVALQVKTGGEEMREDFDPQPCDLSTMHWRNHDEQEKGKCSLLESLRKEIAGGQQKPFTLSSTEY